MAKYIDAERLRKEVKKNEKVAHKSALGCADSETRKFHEGKDFAYQYVGILIDSLQQEQPSLPDNLDNEAEEWAENEAYGKSDAEFEMAYKGFKAGALYERGLKAK